MEIESVKSEHKRVKAFFELLKTHLVGTPYYFGAQPCVLDAQLTPFFSRLRKVNKWSFIEEAGLAEYAQFLVDQDLWKDVGSSDGAMIKKD